MSARPIDEMYDPVMFEFETDPDTLPDPTWTEDETLDQHAATFSTAKYSEDQPRVPAGSSEGGEFAPGGGGGGTIPLTADREYAEGLAAWARQQIDQEGGMLASRDILAALGHREWKANGFESPVYAMAQYVETHSSRGDMLTALDSMGRWGTNWVGASKEWLAAVDQGAHPGTSRETRTIVDAAPSLTPGEQAAFRARTAFVQAFVRKESGDTVVLYRGIHGAQAGRAIPDDAADVHLKVHGLSSWTTEAGLAADFARSGRGVVLRAEIPTSQIFSVPKELSPRQVIRFSDDAGEHVVLSANPVRLTKIHSYGARPRRRPMRF